MRRHRETLVSLSLKSVTNKPLAEPWNAGRTVGARRVLSEEELARLVGALDEHGVTRDRALLWTWMNTAARSVDIRHLRVGDITSPEGRVIDRFRLHQRKTKNTVPVFLLPETVSVLERYLAESGKARDAYLFSPLKGAHAGMNRPLSYSGLRKWLRTWLTRSGIDPWGFGTHSIRRTKGRAVRLGSDIFLESKILGHRDIRTTMAYAAEDEEELRRASLEHDPLVKTRRDQV